MTDEEFFENADYVDEKYLRRMFGCNLKAIRIEKGLSRKDLAEKVFVSDSVIGACERGERSPKLELLCDLADALHVPIDDLLGHDDYCREYERVEQYRLKRACDLVKMTGNEIKPLDDGGYLLTILADKKKKEPDEDNETLELGSAFVLYNFIEWAEEWVLKSSDYFDRVVSKFLVWWDFEGRERCAEYQRRKQAEKNT